MFRCLADTQRECGDSPCCEADIAKPWQSWELNDAVSFCISVFALFTIFKEAVKVKRGWWLLPVTHWLKAEIYKSKFKKHFWPLQFMQLKLKCWFWAGETIQPVHCEGTYNSLGVSDWLILSFSHSRPGNIKTLSGFVHRGRKVSCWQPQTTGSDGMRCASYLILAVILRGEHGGKTTDATSRSENRTRTLLP